MTHEFNPNECLFLLKGLGIQTARCLLPIYGNLATETLLRFFGNVYGSHDLNISGKRFELSKTKPKKSSNSSDKDQAPCFKKPQTEFDHRQTDTEVETPQVTGAGTQHKPSRFALAPVLNPTPFPHRSQRGRPRGQPFTDTLAALQHETCLQQHVSTRLCKACQGVSSDLLVSGSRRC